MDTRHEPDKFHTWPLITAEDFEQRLEEIEKGLSLTKDSLRQALLPPENLAELKAELASIFAAIYDPLNISVNDATDYINEDAETAALIAKKEQALKAELNKIYEHLNHQRDLHIATQLAETEAARQKIMRADGCYAGNHALTLDSFKRNIAIALQQAAHKFFESNEAVRKTPEQFNTLLHSISHISQYGVVHHHDYLQNKYAESTLAELQLSLSELLSNCSQAKELGLLEEIKLSLKSLNAFNINALTDKQPLIEIHHENIHFTKHSHDLEEKSLTVASNAKKLLRDLRNSSSNKIDAFDDDKAFISQRRNLREAILQADNEIDTCRENVARKRDNQPTNDSKSFWERHPVFKSACIGALITLGVIALGVMMTGFIFLTAGAAAAPIGAFFAMLAAKVGIAGTVGLGFAASVPVIGAGALIGKWVGDATLAKNQYRPVELASSTKRLLPDLQSNASAPMNPTVGQSLTETAPAPDANPNLDSVFEEVALDDAQAMTLRRLK